ncbi:plasmid partitioning protein RepB C-terminal domain-containing protein [Sphingobium agri]|uniref:ParB N-terminal domain-containing protein n=1 Tax=Sphingobium agri TaxID=2933566 RepID=A0ABT0DU66_9SPHN|nr:plasmid partitioning protein RepB C-terminal domain-containing protein [Sphingobium agri]MCK0530660.1 ParB N-terminal domain-containing protein [Sphingobium agri]
MMVGAPDQAIEYIPITDIQVLNPRTRSRKLHREIVDNIEAVGLKRPVTVRRHPGTERYDLVCGEGRLEAFRILGETDIPAVVIDADENDCLVMSLVENIARRQHRPIDLLREIGSLHRRGYTDGQIGEKIGCTASWVNMVVQLLERGEERLLSAAETGLIPISLAADIARAETVAAQDLLLEAYASGKLKGKKLGAVRRLLDARMRRHRSLRSQSLGRKSPGRRLSPADLMRLYQTEAEKHRIVVKKADFTQTRLLFLVEALRDLLANEAFVTLLRAEGMAVLPKVLASRLGKEPSL